MEVSEKEKLAKQVEPGTVYTYLSALLNY